VSNKPWKTDEAESTIRQAQRELFRVELDQLVDVGHALVKLGRQINWAGFDEFLGQTYALANGAPGMSTRLMVALHYLKYQRDFSDEAVVGQWVENPYWQPFSGEQFFSMKCQSIHQA
jgi:IS5 family transposase